MNKLMLSLLASLVGAVLFPHFLRAAEADGPDMKETLKWIGRYINEEAGGKCGPTASASSFKYTFTAKPWASPQEAAVEYQTAFIPSLGALRPYSVSFKLADLDMDKIRVDGVKAGDDTIYWLTLETRGGRKSITTTKTTVPGDEKEGYAVETILFLKEQSAQKACRAFRLACQLARNASERDPFASDPKPAPSGLGDLLGPQAKVQPQRAGRELQRREVEKQIAGLEAQLPAARQLDADNRVDNHGKRAELQAKVDELERKADAKLLNGEIIAAAALTTAAELPKSLLNNSATFKDEAHEDKLLREIADLKKQLIDLRD
jgi:hypothetical protein